MAISDLFSVAIYKTLSKDTDNIKTTQKITQKNGKHYEIRRYLRDMKFLLISCL